MELNKTIKIVSAVVDEERLTMYDDNGEAIEILQGDFRLRKILAFITEPLTIHGVVDMPTELLLREVADPMPFEEFEQATGKKVSFFRTTKKFVAKMIRSITGKQTKQDRKEDEHVAPVVLHTALERKQEAIKEILEKAIPASHPDFHSEKIERQKPVHENGTTPSDQVDKEFIERLEDEVEATDTIVAVVDGEIIPGMEMIESQFKHALQFGSTAGVTNLITRLSEVIKKRGHGIDDVLRFMQRGDMRVDDAGNIIAFKALHVAENVSKAEDAPERQFVDVHSKNVTQWIGCIVEMSESLVDHNRSQECSNGLHIARRGYLTGHGFGTVCTIVLVAPEDIIAVPHYDANKVRACRYRIVAELTAEMFKLVKQNKPISDDPAGKTLLANVTKGNVPDVTHVVKILAQKGSKLEITKIGETKPVDLDPNLSLDALPDSVVKPELPDEPLKVAEVQATVNLSRKQVAKQLYDAWVANPSPKTYDDLVAYKKQCKVHWDKLDIPNDGTNPVTDITPSKKASRKPAKEQTTVTAPTPKAVPQTASKTTPREDLALLLKGKTPEQITMSIARSAQSVKQSAKKSWSALGVPPELERAIKAKLDQDKW